MPNPFLITVVAVALIASSNSFGRSPLGNPFVMISLYCNLPCFRNSRRSPLQVLAVINDLNEAKRLNDWNVLNGPQYPVDALLPCLPSFSRLESSAIVRDKMLPQTEGIEGSIFIIRGSRVMLSTHLAVLYNVEPRALAQAVKRNRERFPGDFMFQLTVAERENLKSQIVISSWGGSRRAAPYAFTEQGIAMLSSVLNSRRAIQVNIEIMRAFVRLRQMLASNAQLALKLADL